MVSVITNNYYFRWLSKLLLFTIFLVFILRITDKNLLTETYIEVFVASFMAAIFIFMPEVFNNFKVNWIKNISLYNVLPISVILLVVGVVSEFVIEFSRYIPMFLGTMENIIPIGSLQGRIPSVSYGFIQVTIFAFLAALFEEILFRYAALTGIPIFINSINNVIEKGYKYKPKIKVNILLYRAIPKINRFLVWLDTKTGKTILVIVFSSLFSLLHGPTILSFHIYFIPGVIFSVIYLRYGLLLATLYHMFNNLFTSDLAWNLSKYLYSIL